MVEQKLKTTSVILSQNTTIMSELEKYVHARLEDELKKVRRYSANSLTHISDEEKAILFYYTESGYESLNEMLRDSNGTKISEYGEYLEFVLSKLDSYEGVVYRGTKLSKYKLEKYWLAFENKEAVIDHAFVSTSQKKSIARQFGTIIFEIFSKNGKSIENVSKFGLNFGQNEYEVLFQRASKFLVTGFDKQDNYTLITMEEI